MRLQRFFFRWIFLSVTCVLLIGLISCSATNRLPSWVSFSADANREVVAVPWETSFGIASSEAENSGKAIMLWFTGSDWCKYCTMLEDEVFHTVAFNAWYGDKIVPVMLDFPRQSSLSPELEQQNEMLKERYARIVTSYPTALFINTDGEVIGKLGYIPGGADNWIHQADGILAVTW